MIGRWNMFDRQCWNLMTIHRNLFPNFNQKWSTLFTLSNKEVIIWSSVSQIRLARRCWTGLDVGLGNPLGWAGCPHVSRTSDQMTTSNPSSLIPLWFCEGGIQLWQIVCRTGVNNPCGRGKQKCMQPIQRRSRRINRGGGMLNGKIRRNR